MRRDMIERREGETSFRVKIHHDGMVRCLQVLCFLSFIRSKGKVVVLIILLSTEKGQHSSAALLLPRAEGFTL